MKQLIFLVIFCIASIQAQTFSNYLVTAATGGNIANNGLQIKNRTFAFAGVDTTTAQDMKEFSGVQLGVQTQDTVALIIKYQLSVDGINWSALTTIDSCVQSADTPTVKGVSLTTVALGMPYIRFIFNFTKSNVYGAITYTSAVRKYSASFKKIR